MRRRDFLATAGAALASLGCGGRVGIPGRARWDLVVRNGTIFDGSGTTPFQGDVAITDGRIVAVGRSLSGSGGDEIDARGLAVAPGCIDIHSHADGTLFDDPRAESVIRQGVTTVIVGQDGGSRGPSRDDPSANAQLRRSLRAQGPFASLGDFLAAVDALPSAVNVASMVGLGTVRGIVVGEDDRRATPAEIARMRSLVNAAIEQGACGASSGLEYVPGAFATQEELAAVCEPLAAARLPYATHMRNEDDRLLESLDESIAVAHFRSRT